MGNKRLKIEGIKIRNSILLYYPNSIMRPRGELICLGFDTFILPVAIKIINKWKYPNASGKLVSYHLSLSLTLNQRSAIIKVRSAEFLGYGFANCVRITFPLLLLHLHHASPPDSPSCFLFHFLKPRNLKFRFQKVDRFQWKSISV